MIQLLPGVDRFAQRIPLLNPAARLGLNLLALVLAAALYACGSVSTPQLFAKDPNTADAALTAAAGFPSALPVDRAQPWERLDSQERVAASIDSDSEFAPGVERYLDGGSVADYGEAARVDSGSAGERQVSYAIYRLSLGEDQPGVVAADVNLRRQAGSAGLSQYYIGLSDYSRGSWEWRGPFSDSHVRISTGAAARGGTQYTSALGNLFICLLAYDGADFDIIGAGANRLDLADSTAPPIPGGITATPVAQGLLLQWNGVIASDLAGYRIYWRQAAFTSAADPGVQQVLYLEGLTRHLLLLPNLAPHSVAVSSVDLNGNESAISSVLSTAPLAGATPPLQVELDTASVNLGGSATITATGAASYDFDVDGDGVFDLTNAVGTASVLTTQPGLIRPLVRATTDGETCQALGGVSLIVFGNTRPVASAQANPQTGVAPLKVTFVGTAQDLEDGPGGLSYAWDCNDDGVYDANSNSLTPPLYTYNLPGMWNVKFRVTDSQGAWDVDTISVVVQPKTGVDHTVLAEAVTGRSSTLLVGGMLAAVYQDHGSNSLYYIRATRADATTWGAPVHVADPGAPAIYLSLNTVGGSPAVAYLTSDYGMYYVRATDSLGTAWSAPDEVAAPGGTIFPCDLVEADGNPAIGYGDTATLIPTFVRALNASGTMWDAPVTVDPVPTGGGTTTEIVAGIPAMAYSSLISNKTYYCRASDAVGSAWGTPVELSGTHVALRGDLQVINGLPCVAFTNNSDGNVYFVRANDADGSAWHFQVIAWQRAGVAAGPQRLALAQLDGRAALAVVDGSDGTLWYTEATDPTANQWQTPIVAASYIPQHVVASNPSLLELGGVAALVHDDYFDLANIELWVTRVYR